jgi:REP element-mobilizing transposase RayT
MMEYRQKKKFQLPEFVVMPDHIHLILTPAGITLERAMGLIEGRIFIPVESESGKKARPMAGKLCGPQNQGCGRI